jgi:hypothetical protein
VLALVALRRATICAVLRQIEHADENAVVCVETIRAVCVWFYYVFVGECVSDEMRVSVQKICVEISSVVKQPVCVCELCPDAQYIRNGQPVQDRPIFIDCCCVWARVAHYVFVWLTI